MHLYGCLPQQGRVKPVLADRVLRLLLQGSPADKVLCLTFTRAAAAEMQNRIRNLLGEWAVMAETELDAAITGLTGEAPTPASRRVTQRLFAEVLDTPEWVEDTNYSCIL